MTDTKTPEQLRQRANKIDRGGPFGRKAFAAILRAHADLIDRIDAALDSASASNQAQIYERERAERAEAALEEARRDAERYRWERQNPAWETEAFLSELTPEQYDAAIDEAMK